MSRSRSYTFTLNNYTEDDIHKLGVIDCGYIVYGREVAPTTGTPHLQGYIHFQNARYKKAVEKLFKWHVEVAKGDADQNYDYVSKEGDVYERGTKPVSSKQAGVNEAERWKRARKSAEEGRFEDIDDDIFLRHTSGLKYARQLYLDRHVPTNLSKLDNLWIWGPTGSGKSRLARQLAEGYSLYVKDAGTKWWNGYEDQHFALIEDWDKRHVDQIGPLKLWSDHYAFQAESKGSQRLIRPQRIIITSNYHPSEIWFTDQDLKPIERRFQIFRKDAETNFFAVPAHEEGKDEEDVEAS